MLHKFLVMKMLVMLVQAVVVLMMHMMQPGILRSVVDGSLGLPSGIYMKFSIATSMVLWLHLRYILGCVLCYCNECHSHS